MIEKKLFKNLAVITMPKFNIKFLLLGSLYLFIYLFLLLNITTSFALNNNNNSNVNNNIAVDNSKNIVFGTFSTPTSAAGQNVFTLPVTVTTTQAPIITLLNNKNSGRIMRIIWVCASSSTANVTTVFNVIKNGVLVGNTSFHWYSSYFSTTQPSQASLNTTARGISQGTQLLSFFTAGNSSSNLSLLNNDVILLVPGEKITLAANTTAGTSVVDVSLTWQEFKPPNNN
ncbi:MAG TPA: hypothetical protein VJJ81_00615 [Candidatus Babeliales bacterium]|nr:hypothetical protein [Candidatus Babeliales bacterium]